MHHIEMVCPFVWPHANAFFWFCSDRISQFFFLQASDESISDLGKLPVESVARFHSFVCRILRLPGVLDRCEKINHFLECLREFHAICMMKRKCEIDLKCRNLRKFLLKFPIFVFLAHEDKVD